MKRSAAPPAEGFARRLIQHAARGAPPLLAARLEEEWLADLEARSGTLARLRFGVGCCWATRAIAQEFGTSEALAASAATGSATMSAYAQHDDSFFSRRSVAVIFIIGLHAVLIYAFATGLAAGAIRVVPEVLAGRFIDPPRTPSSPPPLPPPGFTQPRVVIPEDPLVIEAPRDPGATMQNLAPTVGDTVPPSSPPAEMIKRVLGGPGKGFPNTDDYYPSDAKRMGKRGIATVQVCVDVRGILTADPVLAQTSGSAILDGGALRLARAGSGHYRPTTEDGQPVSSCYSYRIRYDLRD